MEEFGRIVLQAEKEEKEAWEAMTEEEKVFHRLKNPPKSKVQILMPIIRKVIPQLIAEEMCSVQPMTLPDENLWNTSPIQENEKPIE